MFSFIMKIFPRIDQKELNKMEKQLQSRFTRVAKRFGKSLSTMMKSGGLWGAAFALINKILNPLKDVQESIDATLKSSADIVTNAKHFGTEAGKLFKLQQLAQSKSVDESSLYDILQKFQTAIAKAENDPSEPSAVRQFVGQKDIAEGFFEFIQSLNKMDKNQQILVQQSVFGEKQILKMASFLGTDFADQIKKIGARDGKVYTPALEKLDHLADLTDVLTARRSLQDRIDKASVMNEGLVRAKDKMDRAALARENQRIKSYEDLAAIQETSEKIMGLMEQGLALIGKLVNTITPTINKIAESLSKLSNSKMMRGLFGFGKKGD